MTASSTPPARRVAAVVWRVALVVLVLGAGLGLATAWVPASDDLSDPTILTFRIVAGVVISTLVIAVIAGLVHVADRGRMADAGFANFRSAVPNAARGAALWIIPAALAFGVLALLGSRLTLTVRASELAATVLLLVLAVLLTEAIPEEAVFRGYVMTSLRDVTSDRWIVVVQAVLFTLFAGALRQSWNPLDLSLFFAVGVVFGYLRVITGSIWTSIGFHTAFQTGSQLVLTHDALDVSTSTGVVMIALGVIPFTVAATLVNSTAARLGR